MRAGQRARQAATSIAAGRRALVLVGLASAITIGGAFPCIALGREVDYAGTIAGTVFGQPFRLPVAVTLAPPIVEEHNPLTLAVGTVGADPNTVPGYLFMRSASRIPPPFALTLTQMAVAAQGKTVTGVVTETGAGTTAVSSNGFTAPNVCDIVEGVQAPLLCISNTFPAEQFYFLSGSQITLQLNGPTVTGQVVGQGNGLVQLLPYPPVIYSATLTATLTSGQPLDDVSELNQAPAAGSPPGGAPAPAIDRTPPTLRSLRVVARRGRATVGTVRLRLSEPGTVTVAVAQLGAGLALGPPLGSGKCQMPTRKVREELARALKSDLASVRGPSRRRAAAKLRRRAVCALSRGAISRKVGRAGRATLSIPRKLAGRRLPRGRYRLTVSAVDLAGNSSVRHVATLTIGRR
jgi:hypothetical protein